MEIEDQNVLLTLQQENKFDPGQLKQNLNDFIVQCTTKQISLKNWYTIISQFYLKGMQEEYQKTIRYILDYEIMKPIYNEKEQKLYKIDVYISYAVHYLYMALTEKDIQKSLEYEKQVIKHIEQCMNIESNYNLIHSIRGFLKFYKGELDQSKNNFKIARQIIESNRSDERTLVIPYIGQAQIEFANKNYAEALKYFKKALTLNPKLPASIRLGMGICFFNLKKFDMAKRAFERTLQLDPKNVQALYGLSTLAFLKNDIDEYFNKLSQAFKIDPKDPIILLCLSEHYLYKNEYKRAQKLAARAIQELRSSTKFLHDQVKKLDANIRNDHVEIKSRLFFVLGHVEHRQGNYDSAMKFYIQSVQINKYNISAQYCLSQVYINPTQINISDSFKCLDFITKNMQDNVKELLFDMYKPLAYITGKYQEKREESIQYYKKAITYNKKDFESLIEFGGFLAETDYLEALNCYLSSSEILLEKQNSSNQLIISPELYNNIGVLQMTQKQYGQSIKNFEQSLKYIDKQFEQTQDEFKKKCYQCTVFFNLGCCYNEQHDFINAELYLQKVINMNDYYLEAYGRLAYMYFQIGNYEKALLVCQQAEDKFEETKPPRFLPIQQVLSIKGYILAKLEDEKNAKFVYDSIKSKYQVTDQYANLSLINLDYNEIALNRDSHEWNKRQIKKILDFVKRILESEVGNIQAAQILSVVMAELGGITQSRETLGQLREFSSQNPKLFFNLGQIEFLSKKFESAIQFYKRYMEKLSSPDEYCETQMALAYLQLGNFKQSQKILKKLILRNPNDMGHRYNLNVVLHEYSFNIIQNKEKKSISETKEAVNYFIAIKEIYDYIIFNNNWRNSRLSEIPSTMVAVKEKKKNFYDNLCERSEVKGLFIKDAQDNFDKYLLEAMDQEQKKERENQEQKKRLDQQKHLRELKEQEEKEKKRKEEELIEQQFQKMLEEQKKHCENQIINKELNQKADNNQKKGKNKNKGKNPQKNQDVSESSEEHENSYQSIDLYDKMLDNFIQSDDKSEEQLKQNKNNKRSSKQAGNPDLSDMEELEDEKINDNNNHEIKSEHSKIEDEQIKDEDEIIEKKDKRKKTKLTRNNKKKTLVKQSSKNIKEQVNKQPAVLSKDEYQQSSDEENQFNPVQQNQELNNNNDNNNLNDQDKQLEDEYSIEQIFEDKNSSEYNNNQQPKEEIVEQTNQEQNYDPIEDENDDELQLSEENKQIQNNNQQQQKKDAIEEEPNYYSDESNLK